MSTNAIGSTPFANSGDLLQQLQQKAAGETTSWDLSGDIVSSIGSGTQARIVSITSPTGTTVTEVGYVSPVLLQKFMDSLQDSLKAASSPDTTAKPSNSPQGAPDPLPSPLSALIGELTPSAPKDGLTYNLVSSFDALVSGTGIGADVSSKTASEAALRSFLSNAAPTLESNAEAVGNRISTSA